MQARATQLSVQRRCSTSTSRQQVAFSGTKPRSVVAQAATTATAPATEAAALSRYQAAKAAGLQPCLQLLAEAGATKQIEPELVEGALAFLEQHQQQAGAAGAAPSLNGSWHLVFSTATKARAFQYIPVRENLVIDQISGAISLESVVGPFDFKIKGRISSWVAATRELGFQFTEVDILLFGNKIWTVNRSSSTKPKTYTWYYVSEGLAAARSSAGGLSLLIKN